MAGVRDWRRRKPREVHTRAETVSQSVLDRLEKLEKREIEWERSLQIILQAIENQIGRVSGIESAICNISEIADEQLKKQAG